MILVCLVLVENGGVKRLPSRIDILEIACESRSYLGRLGVEIFAQKNVFTKAAIEIAEIK